MQPSVFRDVVSGKRRGMAASLARGVLRVAEEPYAMATKLRNRRFDRGHRHIERVSVPVISVGNLTLGGSGKTPMVEWLARWFRARNVPVAVVSRGYGARQGEMNDEARELKERLPDVPHVQHPDRVLAARTAIDQHGARLVLLDDGFQHRRLARDLDIVLIDALQPFGYGHLFPRGTLREDPAGLARAQVVALSRAESAGSVTRAAIRERVGLYAPQSSWCELLYVPDQLLAENGTRQPLSTLAGRRIAAFCGVGNPVSFFNTLAMCGYHVAARHEFPDHHAYGPRDVAWLAKWAAEHDAQAAVCTHKDLVKIRTDQLGTLPLLAVAIEVKVSSGQSELQAHLETVLARCVSPATDGAAE